MDSIIQIGLTNALVATVLAVLAAVVGRALRRPALTHALWILVLLKFITAPLVEIPIGLDLAIEPWRALDRLQSGPAGEDTGPLQDAAAASLAKQAQVLVQNPISEGGTFLSGSSPVNGHESVGGVESLVPEVVTESAAVQTPEGAGTDLQSWFLVAIFIAIAGTPVWFFVQGTRIIRFSRMLKRAQPASASLQRQAERLAAAMGLRRCPQLVVVDGPISPMLWALGPTAKLLFPSELLQRIDAESRATLIAHELAHFHRGDPWVRLLEFVVCGLYWWHPVVWWARREIERAEEACCDAWVVDQFPRRPRQYAEALLDTIDYLSEAPPAQLPLLGSGIGHVDSIRRRLTAIMRGTAPKRLTLVGRTAVLVAASVLLPFQPGSFAKPEGQARAAHIAERADSEKSIWPASSPKTASPNEHTTESLKTAVTPVAHSIRAIALAPNGTTSIATRDGGGVMFRNQAIGSAVDLTAFQITRVAFAPREPIFATGGEDGFVRLWDAETGQPRSVFPGHRGPIRSVAFAPDGRVLASAGRDGQLRLWHVGTDADLSPACMPILFARPVVCVRFAANGKMLAVVTGNSKIGETTRVSLWDLNSKTEIVALRGNSDAVAVSFRTIDGTLAVLHAHGHVTRWDLKTFAKCRTTSSVPASMLASAAFSPHAPVFSATPTPYEDVQAD